MDWHIQLSINAMVSFASAGASLYYVLKHANGKKYLRIISFLVMTYFTIIQLATVFGYISQYTYGADFLRPWMPVLYLIPVFDVIVDFKKKAVPKVN